MLLTISLYASLAIFGLGLVYRVSAWFRKKVGPASRKISTAGRIISAVKGISSVIFSLRFFTLLKALILDVLLQRRIAKEDLLRWLMHLLIYLGFTSLVLMHALHRIITSKIFPGYNSTINPYMFLRDLFGLMILAGCAIALFRRFVLKIPRLASNAMDIYLIVIVCVITVTGIFLEGIKITSYNRYKEMARDYSAAEDDRQAQALESYWVQEFHVVSPATNLSFDGETLKAGKEVHDMSCGGCHSAPQWAFTGFATAQAVTPLALKIDAAGMPKIFYLIHYLACLLALAYLPFSKSFHLVTTPLSLLANSVMGESSDPANVATRQVMELEACTHCGTCSRRCSALAAESGTGNINVLPSEKMRQLKKFINGKKLHETETASLQEGVYLCTNCDRCTVVCPAGINLKELWFQAREDLMQSGRPLALVLSPLSFYRGLMKARLEDTDYGKPLASARKFLTARLEEMKKSGMELALSELDWGFIREMEIAGDEGTFSYCFSCSTCTSTCPVVQNYEKPADELGLLPHQIIHAAALGMTELALGSSMLWDCLTCYKCQESCPQKVRITEIFYKLKNLASARSRPGRGETALREAETEER